MSYTLSNLQSDFDAGSAHLKDSASPYLEFHFASGATSNVFKSTMVKKGGARVAWQQPVLLTGASASTRLRIVAKAHKSLLSDKVIGSGTLDLTAAAAEGGFTTVPLTSDTGKPAGVVRFVVSQGQTPGTAGIHQPAPGSDGVVEGVGGPGHNVESGIAPGGGGVIGGHHQQQGYGAGQPRVMGGQQGYNSSTTPGYGTIGAHQGGAAPAGGTYGSGGTAGGIGGTNNGVGGVGGNTNNGTSIAGIGGTDVAHQQQLAPMGQQGLQSGGIGGGPSASDVGAGSGFGGGTGQQQPHEFHEKRSHNVSDHSENETSEVRHIG